MTIPATKQCPGCAHIKPHTAFYLLRDERLSSYCRTCQRASTRASYHRRRQDPVVLELMRARDRRRKRQARALAAAKGGAL